MIQDMPIRQFLDELAGKKSTPGGGAAAAICGAMGAALVSMVANFTIGKKGYEDVHEDAKAILEKSEALRAGLTGGIEDDLQVFERVMSAYGLPKDTEEQQVARTEAIQTALKQATDVPLECARLCRQVVNLSRSVAEKGNKNVISDAGVAVLAGYAGLKSAALNVYINTGAIKDREFADDRRRQLEDLLEGMDPLKEDIYRIVKDKL